MSCTNIVPPWLPWLPRVVSRFDELSIQAESLVTQAWGPAHCVVGEGSLPGNIFIRVLGCVPSAVIAAVTEHLEKHTMPVTCSLIVTSWTTQPRRRNVSPGVRDAMAELVATVNAEACGTCGTRAVVSRKCSFCGARS